MLLRDRLYRFATDYMHARPITKTKLERKTLSKNNKPLYLFIGPNGSFRTGECKSRSFDLIPLARPKMEQWEKTNNLKT
jgi:hypothetical protein